MHAKLFLATAILFIIFTINGCTERIRVTPEHHENDAGYSDSWYQQPALYDSGPLCSESQRTRLLTDFRNCGSCGNVCNANVADECYNGSCSCGTGSLCMPGFGCVEHACVQQDPNGSPCEFTSNCNPGSACVEGRCSFYRCVPEVCDGFDNDCDGQIDENSDSSGPLSRWCYSGGDVTRIMPPCRRGLQVCDLGGTWSRCEGDVEPRNEVGLLACNGTDDNCDGCVDSNLSATGACEHATISGYDIIYVIDISGSMSSTIAAVKTATLNFSTRFASDPSFRFGIVLTPGPNVGFPPEEGTAWTQLDLSPYTTFITTLMTITDSGGGEEATWDSIYEMGSGENVLSWRPDSIRLMILFTDELAQSYRSARGLMDVNEASVCASLIHGESLVVFTDNRFFPMWDSCARTFQLTADDSMLFNDLNTVISDPCTM